MLNAHRWVERPVSKTDAHRGAQGLHIPKEWFSNRRLSGAQKSWSTKLMVFSVLPLGRLPQRARGNVFWHAPDFSTDTHQVAIRRLNEMAHRNGKSLALLKVPWRLGSNQKVVHVLRVISSAFAETWQIMQQSTCASSKPNRIETNDTSNPKSIETMTRDVIIFSEFSFYSALSFSWK